MGATRLVRSRLVTLLDHKCPNIKLSAYVGGGLMKFDQCYLECLSHASPLIGDGSSSRAVVVDAERSRKAYLHWLNVQEKSLSSAPPTSGGDEFSRITDW